MAVSATQIRQALGAQRSSPWLDNRVLGYIQQHQLYTSPSP
jgi:nicotinic acid mononucleotide adenylyltransferase